MGSTAHEGEPDRVVKPRVQSAARAVEILVAIGQSEKGLTTKEISETLLIGRQATYHLLHTLTAAGVVTRDDNHRYLLGLRVATLAEGFARQLAPSEHLAPIVRSLAQDTGETAYAAGWWSGEIMSLSVARGTNAVQAAEVPQGYVGNAHARASGKLLLAFASPAVRDAYLDQHEFKRLTKNTITNRRIFEKELEAIRECGYAVDNEEFAEGLCCVSVPFERGYSPFVLAISGPHERITAEFDRYMKIMSKATSAR